MRFSFRGKGSIYQLVKDVINNDLSAALRNTVNVIASATVLAVLFFVLGYVIISAIQPSVVAVGKLHFHRDKVLVMC